jgi:glutathione S-transferase
MRARMGLVLGEVNFTIHEVSLKNKPQSLLDVSPKGTVPVLQTDEGMVIDESLEIITWACGNDFNHELIAENDGDFKRALDRYKYPNRYPDKDCSGARDLCEAFFEKLDGVVVATGQTLTDICIFPFVRQCANVDREWFDGLPYRNLQAWLGMNIASELFQVIFDKNFKGF